MQMPKGFISILEGNISRKKREKILDLIRNGAPVGKYSPRFKVIDAETKASSFSGRFVFTP
jgi:hypothetical protein